MLLCVDYWKLGFNKIIVNPNIKVAYEYPYYYLHKYIYDVSKNIITYFYYYFKNTPDYEDYANYDDNIPIHPNLHDFMLN